MGAPGVITRGTPAGLKLKSGFHTVIGISGNTTIKFFEQNLTPLGVSGGEKIDTTTFWNTSLRTYHPRDLWEATGVSGTVAYDPAVLTEITAIVNKNREFTVLFYDLSTWSFWGWLTDFTPNSCTEGEMPTAEITISASNTDGSAEQVPVVVEVAGT